VSKAEAARVEQALGVAVIRHGTKKPMGGDAMMRHFGVSSLQHVAMVGDRVLTDVLCGNLNHMLTIQTLPLTEEGDIRLASLVVIF
jgi:phosphatidylglycerophosphatase GEP4